ncbi:MAG: glycosyltransferase family 4 protein [Gammaproteobacteria bacterium]
MKLAFCLFYYFPHGGLQRDFMRIATACRDRGHTLDVYTLYWKEPIPEGFNVYVINNKIRSNHQRINQFVADVQARLTTHDYDLVIGFNRMPGLDIYYGADCCFVAKSQYRKNPLLKLTQRYRYYARLEAAVFGPNAHTNILLISEREKQLYQKHYGTSEQRIYLLPPGIDQDRRAPPNAVNIRAAMRDQYKLAPNNFLLLAIGSGFKTKGVDRSIRALASLNKHKRQQCKLFIIGHGNKTKYKLLAKRLGVKEQVYFLGLCDDIPRWLLAADLLLHPARTENTGTVLLEALVAGLPVLASANCGYAKYITEAQAGRIIPETFSQANMNVLLSDMLNKTQLTIWQHNALNYSQHANLFGLVENAVNFIEQHLKTKMA